MERYQHGKIYKLVCNITGKIYIGSTCKKLLSQRLASHVQDFKKFKRDPVKYHNITSFQILEGNDYYIELLEICSCTINEELLARERFYIKNNDCVNKLKNLNCTKEDDKEHKKEYYEKNIDLIKEQQKKYREKNKDTIKEHEKEYYEKNKDKLKEKIKEYYEKNKDTIKEKRKIKITCECGSIIRYCDLSTHKKTLKHKSYIESLNHDQPPLTNKVTI